MSAAIKPMKECPYYKGMGFYTSDSNFDPAVEWPGTTWQKLEGVFILAASSGHPVGESGGEESHALSETEMPIHSHVQTKEMPNKGIAHVVKQFANGGYYGDTYGAQTTWLKGKAALNTDVAGGGQPHNNMPPYITRVYWERIA